VSLRRLLLAGVVTVTAVAVLAFGTVAYLVFVRQQDAELERLLVEDLRRVTALLDRPVLGATLLDPGDGGVALQIVANDETVLLSWGSDAAIPAADGVELRRTAGRRQLVVSGPWNEGAGSIRLAHDVEAAFAARRSLAGSLVTGGALVFLAVALLASLLARRAVAPLEEVARRARLVDPAEVARRARLVDPAEPRSIGYEGSIEEIRVLADALDDTLGAIRTRQDEERRFLLEVAHELAAPLTLVNYHLSRVDPERPSEDHLVAARAAAKELLRTSQDLLGLARGELERPLERVVVDLADVADRIVLDYPGVQLEADRPAAVIGDEDRLAQVLRNLVRNGVQAAGREEGVRVRVYAGSDEHRIEVRDDGPGIDPELADSLFEPGVGRGGGSGVGLTICRTLVHQHGGAIRARAGEEAGALFEVRLPSLQAGLEAS